MTTKPTRLVDDGAIEPELRDALGVIAERQPEPFDVPGGLERLQGALTTGPASPSDPTWFARYKLQLLLGGGGVVAGASLVVWNALGPAPVAPPARSPAAVVAPAIPSATAESTPAPEHAPEPEPTAALAAPPPTAAPVTAPSAPKAASAKATLAEEVRQLGEVRALAASDPAGAARKADEGHRRFAGGMLYQEREAVAITSLAKAGRGGEARARADRFLTQFPRSPFAEQVRAATGVGP